MRCFPSARAANATWLLRRPPASSSTRCTPASSTSHLLPALSAGRCHQRTLASAHPAAACACSAACAQRMWRIIHMRWRSSTDPSWPCAPWPAMPPVQSAINPHTRCFLLPCQPLRWAKSTTRLGWGRCRSGASAHHAARPAHHRHNAARQAASPCRLPASRHVPTQAGAPIGKGYRCCWWWQQPCRLGGRAVQGRAPRRHQQRPRQGCGSMRVEGGMRMGLEVR